MDIYKARKSQCVVLGYPRNDFIFRSNGLLKQLGFSKKTYIKVVLWLPTWRGTLKHKNNNESDVDFPILNSKNVKRLNKFLVKSDILLIIKPHPNQSDLIIFNQIHSNIKILRNKDFEDKDIYLYEIFNEVDALLTDYSSVYFDFLLTMKPIGFTIDDIDSYGNKRGFIVDNPLDLMPGSKITNLDDLVEFLRDLKVGKDDFYFERKKVNDLANKYKDGNSSKRLVEFLGM